MDQREKKKEQNRARQRAYRERRSMMGDKSITIRLSDVAMRVVQNHRQEGESIESCVNRMIIEWQSYRLNDY